jgi:UDP-N-acetylglucosamine--N-acetylmuramyl-(pentapeptide) pyrophosphoryl-undecaprenol N-acetylglucosamine transferase
MSAPGGAPLVLLTAGGTGGHLFPAEALAAALKRRGLAVALATDTRAAQYGRAFPAENVHIVPSATLRGRDPFSLARTAATLAYGIAKAALLLARLKPAIVVGFGGYPSVPPVLAAAMRKIPTLIHEQNGVMGRGNRLLAGRVTAIATGFPGVLKSDAALAAKSTFVGNPVRPAVIVAAETPYRAPAAGEPLRILVFGGSQGARIMADIVPSAVERLPPAAQMNLVVTQQTREEDIPRVREAYARAQVRAEIAPFFDDLPARMAAAHLAIARSGASTVAELSAIGRPALLVPLPHALDQDQLVNARVLEKAGGAILVAQDAFTPDRVAAEIAALQAEPERLSAMALGARSAGTLDAAERLADLVTKVAGI